jgi:hypothetical protein
VLVWLFRSLSRRYWCSVWFRALVHPVRYLRHRTFLFQCCTNSGRHDCRCLWCRCRYYYCARKRRFCSCWGLITSLSRTVSLQMFNRADLHLQNGHRTKSRACYGRQYHPHPRLALGFPVPCHFYWISLYTGPLLSPRKPEKHRRKRTWRLHWSLS